MRRESERLISPTLLLIAFITIASAAHSLSALCLAGKLILGLIGQQIEWKKLQRKIAYFLVQNQIKQFLDLLSAYATTNWLKSFLEI